MESGLWAVIVILICIILLLIAKLYYMRKSAREIEKEFTERLMIPSNTLISISGRDSSMRSLAAAINVQLKKLREDRHRFLQGDLELKEAITNISHDLRTPLTVICGYLELLEQEEKSEEVSRYLSMIANRTEALQQLKEELFRYSLAASSQEMPMERTNLCMVLEESVLSFYGVLKQSSIIPNVQIPETPIWRNLNPAAVSRIFNNIISNALKYSDGDFSIYLEEDGTITFANTAHGLTPVTIGRLFDRFYTVETGRNSTGLGLSIAKLLTEQLGGTIRAEYMDETLKIIVSFP